MRLCACMFALAVVASGQVPQQHHPPSSAEYAKVLEDPSRDEWQKPHDVVMALDLKSTGFTLSKRLDILPYQYYLFFEKR